MSNAQKTWMASSLNRFAEGKALDAIQLTGKGLPATVKAVSGSIVTVNFAVRQKAPFNPFTLPPVTVPVFGPEYIRYPIQVGCLGVVLPVDYFIGAMTGLGDGDCDLGIQANLSNLVFFPVGNKNWGASEDPNKVVIYGPDGAVLRTTDKTNAITVDKTTGILIKSNVKVRIQAPAIESSQS